MEAVSYSRECYFYFSFTVDFNIEIQETYAARSGVGPRLKPYIWRMEIYIGQMTQLIHFFPILVHGMGLPSLITFAA